MADAPLSPSHESLNFNLPPGKRSCFYEELTPGDVRKLHGFVLAAGDMQIALSVYGPLEEGSIAQESFEDPIMTETISAAAELHSDSQSIIVDFDAPEQGTYAYCLDNRRAHFFPKFVQFDVTPANPVSSEMNFTMTKEFKSQVDASELEGTIAVLQRINKGIASIRAQQLRDRYRLNLHTTTNTNNYNHAFYGSLLETAIFVLVALFQIFFIRRWFASKSPRKPAQQWN